MAIFKVEGGNTLHGDIVPQGAKNEALQVICATLLTSEPVTIKNVPDISDVNVLIWILKNIGVEVIKNADHEYTFIAKDVHYNDILKPGIFKKCQQLRGSVMIMGPLLARYGKAYIPSPGGDKIGRRRLDVHFEGMEKLGAKFVFHNKKAYYEVLGKKLTGNYHLLEEASVTGTANIIMASVMAKGKTTIYNAACEPYVQQLCKMINSMGGHIEGIGSNLLHIKGVDSLQGCNHAILPDMIEIGSFIGLAAMAGSGITIKNAAYETLGIIPRAFNRLGIHVQRENEDIYIPRHDHYEIETFIDGSIMKISDAIWPGLTPDLLSIFLVVSIQARGSVLIHQKMFESRLFFVDKLIDMGAQIILCDPHRATVIGQDKKFRLKGQTLTSPDIRAGVALLIAALSGEGTSYIHNIEQIDRGYQHIDERLRKINADITRIENV